MKQHRKPITFVLAVALITGGASLLLAQAKGPPPLVVEAPVAHHLGSWTSDRSEYNVGDVVTVLVTEATLATATKSQSGSDQQTRQNDLALAPPGTAGAAAPSITASLATDKNASSTQAGDAKRGVNFKGDISVRVIAIDKSGQLQIKGTKLVDVDKNKQTLSFTGWVRPQDISTNNVVVSERVADASLTYELTGDIGGTRGGLLGRIINKIWP